MAKVKNELAEEHKAADLLFRQNLERDRLAREQKEQTRKLRQEQRAAILLKLGITDEELRILLDA